MLLCSLSVRGFFLSSFACTRMQLGRREKSKELIILRKKNKKPLEPRIGSVVFRRFTSTQLKRSSRAINGDFDTHFLFVVVVVVDFVSRFFRCSY